ncbi:MAG: YggT family protein [Clostridia bacterium]
MEEMTKQTEMRNINQEGNMAKRIVGIIFGVIEIVLAFRLVFKLLGANPANGFVQGIYKVTKFLVDIFEGIFSKATTNGAETTAVLEPAVLIAMVVVAIIAWVVLKLMNTQSGTHVERTEYKESDKQK